MIEFDNVSKTYETGNRALRDISLKINDGEFVFIVGRSGSGKSTLIKLITRELKATDGSIRINGKDLGKLKAREIPKYRRGLGVVFQDFRLLNDRNVYENIAFAQRVIGASGREIKENVPEILKLTGLSAKYKNMPNQLSGGEQQRVAIARALINKPSVILADEPTGNLDERNSQDIMRLLYEINERGTTVIVITHSRHIVESANKRVIVMEKGVITSDNPPGFFPNAQTEKPKKEFVIRSAFEPTIPAENKDTKVDTKADAGAEVQDEIRLSEEPEETDTVPWDDEEEGSVE